jgi:hypothetical protein
VCLFVLDNTDLGGAQHSAVELETLLLNEEDGAVLLIRLGSHESSLLLVGVELLALGAETLEAVLLQGVHEDVFGHLETLVQVGEILNALRSVLGVELVLGNHSKSAVEVVDAVDEILGELLDGEIFGGLDLTGGALLQVTEVGDSAQALVLPVLNLGLLGLESLLELSEGIVLGGLLLRLGFRLGLLSRLGLGLLGVAVPS